MTSATFMLLHTYLAITGSKRTFSNHGYNNSTRTCPHYTTKARQISLKNDFLLPYGGLNRSTTPTEIKSTTPAKQNKTATLQR